MSELGTPATPMHEMLNDTASNDSNAFGNIQNNANGAIKTWL